MKTQHWKTIEDRISSSRNAYCTRGATREEALATYDAEQQRNNRRYDAATKNLPRTAASYK